MRTNSCSLMLCVILLNNLLIYFINFSSGPSIKFSFQQLLKHRQQAESMMDLLTLPRPLVSAARALSLVKYVQCKAHQSPPSPPSPPRFIHHHPQIFALLTMTLSPSISPFHAHYRYFYIRHRKYLGCRVDKG